LTLFFRSDMLPHPLFTFAHRILDAVVAKAEERLSCRIPASQQLQPCRFEEVDKHGSVGHLNPKHRPMHSKWSFSRMFTLCREYMEGLPVPWGLHAGGRQPRFMGLTFPDT